MLKGSKAEYAKTTWVCRGRYRIFQKGGVETRDTKCGGGALHCRPDTKSGGGGGGVLSTEGPIRKRGGGSCCPALQAGRKKRGGGEAI